jgi:hypothetical protein
VFLCLKTLLYIICGAGVSLLMSYNRLLSLYNLVNVNCRADIYTAVAASFDSYCFVNDDNNDDA